MKNTIIKRIGLGSALWLAAPTALWGHEGHAGDHGWLAGALQPLLSVDHLLAGIFVAGVLSVGLALVRGCRSGSSMLRTHRRWRP